MIIIFFCYQGYGQLPTPTIVVGDHVMKASTWDQTEPAIAIDKTKPPHLLVSFNTIYHRRSSVSGQGYYYSPDGGITCYGYDHMPNGQAICDPSAAFDAEGIGYLTSIDGDLTGFMLVTTPDDGQSWNPTQNVHVAAGGDFDKEMAMAIDESNSLYTNNYYVAWTDLGSQNIKSQWSGDVGVTWNNETTISINPGSGANVQTGPNGEVYICWADWTNSSYPGQNIGFASSFCGGLPCSGSSTTYSYSLPISYNSIGVHGNNADPNFGNTRVNGDPSMAVDKSCVANRGGRIYIVYPEWQAISPGDTISVINMKYSNDQGLTWLPSSGPVRISKSGLDQCWFPWIAVDDMTGVASVIYFGYSGGASNTYTHVAYSDPNDPTNWGDITVSSGSQTPEPITGPRRLVANYEGDYLGIASYAGHAYPVWKDRRSGLRQIWIADIEYDAPQLLSSATNLQIPCSSLTPTVISGIRTYQAAQTIAVANCGGEVSIGSAANVTMTAGQSITIGPGFSTQPGAVFTAQIQSVTPCQTPGAPWFKTNTPDSWSSDSSIIKKDIDGMKMFAYPNPTSDLITVGALNDKYKTISFTVTDISGRLIAKYDNVSRTIGNVRQTIDISAYADGIYIVTMNADNEKYSLKFAKE